MKKVGLFLIIFLVLMVSLVFSTAAMAAPSEPVEACGGHAVNIAPVSDRSAEVGGDAAAEFANTTDPPGVGIDVTQLIIAGIGLLFTAVIVPLVRAAFGWLKGKTKNEALLTALKEAEKVADQVVASLQQNVVEGLKAKSKDGKLTADDVAQVADTAVDMFFSDISERSLTLLEDNAEDITTYIGNLIESRLVALKKVSNGG